MTTKKRKRLITVTQDDIDKGKPNTALKCPIALAVNRKFNTSSARIGITTGSFHGYRRFNLPTRAQEFIFKFDRRQEVEPFKFYIEVPDES